MSMAVEKKYAPTLNLIYLPHLDYGLQRVGPDGDMAKDLREIDALFEEITGVEHVLDAVGKREFGIHHERSGELVLISEKDAWFTYYYWEDDDSAPDYARTVNIHSKPGYDPWDSLSIREYRFQRCASLGSCSGKCWDSAICWMSSLWMPPW